MIGAKWKGLEEALRDVERLGKELGTAEVLEPALLDVARPLRDDITRTAPRSPDAPHMADEFVAIVSKEEREQGRALVKVGPRAGRGSVGFVAGFIEFGTSRLRARPFIRPAYDAWETGAPRALAAALRKRFERITRKYLRRAH